MRASLLALALSGGTPLRFFCPPTCRMPSATDRAASHPFKAAHASSSSGSGHTPARRPPWLGSGRLRSVETRQAAPTAAAPGDGVLTAQVASSSGVWPSARADRHAGVEPLLSLQTSMGWMRRNFPS